MDNLEEFRQLMERIFCAGQIRELRKQIKIREKELKQLNEELQLKNKKFRELLHKKETKNS